MNFPTAAASLAIQVAELQVHLECNRQELIEALSARYKEFRPISIIPSALQVHLQVEPSSHRSGLWSSTPIYRDGQIHFQGPAYSGWIDLENKRGSLELQSSQPVDEVDYFLRIVYAWLSFRAGGMLFHAAGVRRHGLAFIFFGPSESGKTTAARLSSSFQVLNDDLLLLDYRDNRWWADSTPFTNATQVSPQPGSAPLAGLYRLVKDEQVYLESISSAEAAAEVLACVPLISSAPACIPQLFSRCRSLVTSTPVHRLHFRREASFWDLLVTESSED